MWPAYYTEHFDLNFIPGWELACAMFCMAWDEIVQFFYNFTGLL